MSDARQIIFEEITSKIGGSKKLAGDTYMICCPYHNDRSPSGGINLAVESNIPLGYYHCFGCGEKRPWNALAATLGLHQFKGWELSFKGNGGNRESRKTKAVTYESHKQELRRALNTYESIDWPAYMSWRGYSGSLLRKLGGVFYNDPMTQEVMLFFPIYVNTKYKGGVRAYLEKQTNGLSYLTTKGEWVKDYGLLGYEYIKKIMRKRKYTAVVLVEGPRDMLRLIDNKIPALAVLGSENFSEKKLLRVLALNSMITTIYVMPDNDKAGTKMYKTIKRISGDMVKVKRLKLPREKDMEGNVIKMDPDDAPIGLIKQVKRLLEDSRKST